MQAHFGGCLAGIIGNFFFPFSSLSHFGILLFSSLGIGFCREVNSPAATMHSLRRTALRSAASASRTATRTQPIASFACQLVRNASVGNGAAMAKACAPSAARYFSQTFRVANAEETADTQGIENAEKSAEEVGSTQTQGKKLAHTTSGSVLNTGLTIIQATGAAQDMNPGETPYGLFVRNMVFDATDQHLKEAFEKYGTISKTAIARDARGLSRGYGFVWFSNAEDMNRAAAEANGSFWHGRRIQVQPRVKTRSGRGAAQSEPTSSIYIGNIPYETTDVELNRLFRDMDNVTDVRVAVDRTTGWPRGFAHADFADTESAVKAYGKLQGMLIGGRELRLDYSAPSGRNSRSRTPDRSQNTTGDDL